MDRSKRDKAYYQANRESIQLRIRNRAREIALNAETYVCPIPNCTHFSLYRGYQRKHEKTKKHQRALHDYVTSIGSINVETSSVV